MSNIQNRNSAVHLPLPLRMPCKLSCGSVVVPKRTAVGTSCFVHFLPPFTGKETEASNLVRGWTYKHSWRIWPIKILLRSSVHTEFWARVSCTSRNKEIKTFTLSFSAVRSFFYPTWNRFTQTTFNLWKKHRHGRFKITFLIRHYNDTVLYMVPPVKIGVRAAP